VLRIPEGQLVVAEADLRDLHDRLYRLESAVEDVDGDLAGRPGPAAYREAFAHLYEAARDLVGVVIEPARE
jgi:tetrahydromethanopterin S-methyltransferase subunit G